MITVFCRVLPRPLGDRDRFVARERTDHDVGPELHHEPTRLLEGQCGSLVAAADTHEVEILAAGRTAGHPGRWLLLVLRLRACVLRERGDGARRVHLVAEGECALAVGHDREPHFVGLRRCRERTRGSDRRADCQQRQRKQELPLPYFHMTLLLGACTIQPESATVSLRQVVCRFPPHVMRTRPPPARFLRAPRASDRPVGAAHPTCDPTGP